MKNAFLTRCSLTAKYLKLRACECWRKKAVEPSVIAALPFEENWIFARGTLAEGNRLKFPLIWRALSDGRALNWLREDSAVVLTLIEEKEVAMTEFQSSTSSLNQLKRIIDEKAKSWLSQKLEENTINYAIWKRFDLNFHVGLFAIAKSALVANEYRQSNGGFAADRCVPQSLALMAYYRHHFANQPCALMLHIGQNQTIFLLIFDLVLVATQTIEGNLNDCEERSKEVKAQAHQAVLRLQAKWQSLWSLRDANDPGPCWLILGRCDEKILKSLQLPRYEFAGEKGGASVLAKELEPLAQGLIFLHSHHWWPEVNFNQGFSFARKYHRVQRALCAPLAFACMLTAVFGVLSSAQLAAIKKETLIRASELTQSIGGVENFFVSSSRKKGSVSKSMEGKWSSADLRKQLQRWRADLLLPSQRQQREVLNRFWGQLALSSQPFLNKGLKFEKLTLNAHNRPSGQSLLFEAAVSARDQAILDRFEIEIKERFIEETGLLLSKIKRLGRSIHFSCSILQSAQDRNDLKTLELSVT